MEKYKICPNPNCGKHNKSSAIECAWCETDLSSVKPTDDATEAARAQIDNESEDSAEQSMPLSTSNMIRICESCGAHNAANARKCNSCGEDISDVTPTPEIISENIEHKCIKPKYSIISVDDSIAFAIPEGKTVIGREETLREYLGQKSYVSRKHAEMEYVDGVLTIRNLSNTNYTYVNNRKIVDSDPVILKEGDEIGLGGNITKEERQEQAAYFRVKVD